ncbi:MAG TPA: LysR substrate-binding domain-containing protein [Castellaniella sp.]|jgi:LysR family nitrogen assimilation transcriptional regulator|nr:LysR substrate-binding domain-containing protein [Castellaniella sp.]
MNLRQLGYFVRVAEMHNMTRAAETLHVAQPALSQQIALLEEELEIRLFDREPKGVRLTAEGELLLRHAHTILRQVGATRSILTRTAGDVVAGSVSIAMASSTARILALPLLRAVKRQYPAIVVEIVDIPSADLTLMVQQGRVDFSLSPDQEELNDLITQPLLVEEILLLIHPSVQLPKGPVPITELARLPMILPRPPNKLRMRIDYAFMNARLTYNLLAQASTSAILIPSVVEGMATTILPYSAAYREIHDRTIVPRHLDPRLSREIRLCFNKNAPVLPAVEKVMELTRTTVSTLIESGHWRYCTLV